MPLEQTTTGLTIQDIAEIKGEYDESYRLLFGADVPLGVDSVFGKEIGVMSEREALLQALRPVVCRWALVWTGSPDLSEDVAQEVLLRVSRSLLDSTRDAKLTTWVYRITRNVAVDVARRDGKDRDTRTALRLHALTEASAPAADREMELRTATALLQRMMKSLSSQQRAAFDLVDVQGVSSADAAEMLDIAPATLRVHLHRARQSLRALGGKESDE